MSDNTIFDDVFRTMMEKMTFLVVPLINDVFIRRIRLMWRLCSCVMSISGWMVRLLRIRGC